MNNNMLQPIQFHEDTIYIIDADEEEPRVPVKPIVENMGINWASQYAKLMSRKDRWGVVILATPSRGGLQEMVCLPLRKLAAYLYSIDPNKVRPDLKKKVELYQDECDGVLWDYWTKGVAVNKRLLSGDHVPEGMVLVTAEEYHGLYRKVIALQEDKLRMIESKVKLRVNFSPDEDATVIRLLKLGLNQGEIAREMGRPKGSIHSAMRRLQAKGILSKVQA